MMEEKEFFNLTWSETEQMLQTNVETGLNNEEVTLRREKYGSNELKAKKKKSLFIKFLEQFKDFMIIVLIISAIISGIIGIANGEGITDTIIIMIVIIVNAIIGVAQESKAEKSLEALQKLSSHVAKVERNGKLEVLPSKELVPGDVVVLETGDFVPADLRLCEAVNLKAQESALTGESVPVEKIVDKIEKEDIGIGDRVNMLFSSSLITYGRGKGIVVKTGMNTEVGKIAEIINSAEENETPLQEKLGKLRKNTWNCSINYMCSNFWNRTSIWKRTNPHVYDSCKFSSCSNSRGLASSINNSSCHRCSKNGKEKCHCKKTASC